MFVQNDFLPALSNVEFLQFSPSYPVSMASHHNYFHNVITQYLSKQNFFKLLSFHLTIWNFYLFEKKILFWLITKTTVLYGILKTYTANYIEEEVSVKKKECKHRMVMPSHYLGQFEISIHESGSHAQSISHQYYTNHDRSHELALKVLAFVAKFE